MIKTLFKVFCLAAVSMLVFVSQGEARNCVKGKPCGNSCISKNDVCHIGSGSSASTNSGSGTGFMGRMRDAVRETTSGTTQSAETGKAKVKNCRKGKACGNTCIPQDAVCHE